MWSFSRSWIIPKPQRERVPCFERNSASRPGRALNIIPWLLDTVSLPVPPCLCLIELLMAEFHNALSQWSFPLPQVLVSQSSCIEVEPFVEPITLVPFSTVSAQLFFILKAPNIPNIFALMIFSQETQLGGLWLTLSSGLRRQNNERAPFWQK